ncbi:MAG: DUF4143 domain-containing protein [Acidimicrobiaceae bacterium]|nr:DUF4143 domain-containing protein [Acidimicrobiaceae bacterium]MYE96811.1 DUF4143 domain-containing protein [Acidimicrobiaceae bacterium]MYI55019.1 DUF4143 domain-containing protein [Acidimicrobiaceae bacterium]
MGDYVNEAVRTEVYEAVGVRHQPGALLRLVRSIARNVATEAKIAGLAVDAGGDTPLARGTAADYLRALERIFVVETQPAWSVELRSRATLRKSPKIHFVDPSLAASSLRASPGRLLADPETLGLLFESLVVRDLRVYSQAETGSGVPLPRQRRAGGRRRRRAQRRSMARGGGEAQPLAPLGGRGRGVAAAPAGQALPPTGRRPGRAARRHLHRAEGSTRRPRPGPTTWPRCSSSPPPAPPTAAKTECK